MGHPGGRECCAEDRHERWDTRCAPGKGGAGRSWIEAIEASSQARRGFYAAVRHELGIPTTGSTEVFEWQMTKYLIEQSAAAD
jgi:hypothetical protein